MRTFTFGFDHKHPITGESLSRHYIQVPGDADQSRDIMLAVFGRNWAMQYESPSKLKHLDRMTELQWTDELRDRAAGYLTELMESVRTPTEVDDELLTTATAAARSTAIDAYFDDLKAGVPEELAALRAEAYVGKGVTEYAMRMKSGAHHLLPDSEAFQTAYPIGKQVYHEMKFGGMVYVRRVAVLEDWRLVTKEEANELVRQYTEHVVDLSDPQNLVGKTMTVSVPKDERFGKSYDEYVAKQPPGMIELP